MGLGNRFVRQQFINLTPVVSMPPRWPRKPDRRDPAYRRLDDRMNFALHVATFSAINSGMWFFNTLQPGSLPWARWVALSWALILLAHLIYVFAIANYSELISKDAPPKSI